jgi:aminoglycoside phosphotransferase (APT) family kinase protein
MLVVALNAPVTEINPVDVIRSVGWGEPECVQIEGGWDTYIWRFETADGKAHALRLYRAGDGRDIEAMHKREGHALEALRAGGIPCPELEAQGVYQGLPFFILSWLPGRNLLTVLEQQPWKLWRLGREFGRLQARLHKMECPDNLCYQSEEEWLTTAGDEAIVQALRGKTQETTFCHFDFHPINVMCHQDQLVGVLDFTFSGRADARADLGRTKALLTAAPIPPSPKKPILQYLRTQFASNWRKGYTEEAGQFPLEPIFEAWGAGTFVDNIEEAVAEGRGWGTPKDIEKMRRYLQERKRAAGLL